jgi:small subunit ribosomal protein S8
MAMNDPLAAVMSCVLNAEKIGKRHVIVRRVSKVITKVLSILNENGYVGTFEKFEDMRGGFIKISLLGRINKCGVIKPRFAVAKDGYEKFEKRFLPAKNFGVIIVSTSKGMMVQEEAKKQNLGGKLVAYCY